MFAEDKNSGALSSHNKEIQLNLTKKKKKLDRLKEKVTVSYICQNNDFLELFVRVELYVHSVLQLELQSLLIEQPGKVNNYIQAIILIGVVWKHPPFKLD